MGNNTSRPQPGFGYPQNLFQTYPDDYDEENKHSFFSFGRRKGGRDYGRDWFSSMARPGYGNGYTMPYPMTNGYPVIYPQGVQYVPQPQMMYAQPQQQQPGISIPQPQIPAQQNQPQHGIPGMSGNQMPQPAVNVQPVIPGYGGQSYGDPGAAMPQAPQYPTGYYNPDRNPEGRYPEGRNPEGHDPEGRNPEGRRSRTPYRMPSPLGPADADAYGPPGPRPRTPLRNPLPSPPKDVFELEPYRSLIGRDLTGLWSPPLRAPPDSSDDSESDTRRLRRRRKGLFGSLSRRDRDRDRDRDRKNGLWRSLSAGGRRSEMQPSLAGMMYGTAPPGLMPQPTFPGGYQQQPGSQQAYQNQPIHTPISSSSEVPPIRFHSSSPHAGFLPHSPHTIFYKGDLYPTAMHLFEALKFLNNDRPDLAARIRTVENTNDVYPLAESLKQYAKEGFENELSNMMDEVLYHKFTQHPALRDLLLNTGIADLIYAEGNDTVWGEGPLGGGMNHLGRALMRLRDRLRAEMGIH